MKKALLFAAKLLTVLLASFLCLYAVNSHLAAFLAKEKAALSSQPDLQEIQFIRDYHCVGQHNEVYDQNVSAQVILMGTSHTTHGINPKYLKDEDSAVNFFNFALNGASPTYQKRWYNEVFKAAGYPKPKAIVYGVEWFMFDDSYMWRRFEHDAQHRREVSLSADLLNEEITDLDSLTSYVYNTLPLFYANDRLFDMFGPVEQSQAEEPLYEGVRVVDEGGCVTSSYYNGFIPWENPAGTYTGEPVVNFIRQDNPQVIQDFYDLLDQFEDEGIPVIFVMTPEYHAGSYAPGAEDKVAFLESVAAQYDIPFLNYNYGPDELTEMTGDPQWFSDWDHMNEEGSTKFSCLLKEDLDEVLEAYIG